jgi:hypothetical protein
MGKFRRMNYKSKASRHECPLQKPSVDVCTLGTMFPLIVDEATRFKWAYLMSENSQSTGHLKPLILRLHVQFKESGWCCRDAFRPSWRVCERRA